MSIKLEKLTPAIAIHPGEVLKDELESREIKQKDFAELIGVQATQLNEIINGKRGINADLALLIGKALKMDPKIWINLQSNYELDLAKINEKTQNRLQSIGQWQMIQSYIPEYFFRKQGYIKGNPFEDIETIKSIYNIKHFEQLASLQSQTSYYRLRKSPRLTIDKINLLGWIKGINYEASNLNVAKFDFREKDKLIISLRDILWKNKNTLIKTKDVLHDFGIKLVIMDHPEKCPIDGFAFWNKGNPSIGLTLRHKRIDNFAFTLFHELGHIFLHLVNNNTAEYVDVDTDNIINDENKEEREANDFAKNYLISPENWDEYFKSPTKSQEKSMLNLARKEKIHPAIIKGRLCHEMNNYRLKTRIDHNIY